MADLEIDWEKSANIVWDSFEDVVNANGTLLLYTGRFNALIVPQGAFTDEDARTAFSDAVYAYLLASYEVDATTELFRSEKKSQL